MQADVLKLEFNHLGPSIFCETKIMLYNEQIIKKYLTYLENCAINKQPAKYYSDTFHNFVLNISRTTLKIIKKKIFDYLKMCGMTDIQNLYYILGEYNNFGIYNVLLQDNKLILELQFELYYNLKDFTNISGSLSFSNQQIYTHCIINEQFNCKELQE